MYKWKHIATDINSLNRELNKAPGNQIKQFKKEKCPKATPAAEFWKQTAINSDSWTNVIYYSQVRGKISLQLKSSRSKAFWSKADSHLFRSHLHKLVFPRFWSICSDKKLLDLTETHEKNTPQKCISFIGG